MARLVWYRFHRNARLWWRAEAARFEHEFIHGSGDSTKEPKGILYAHDVKPRLYT